MSEVQRSSASLSLEPMFGGSGPDAVRKEVFYEANFPAMKELSEKGVRFYQVAAKDFFSPIVQGIKEGNRERVLEVFDDAAIVCQLGDDRSKVGKLLAIELGAKPALTAKDKRLLAQGVDSPRIGMSWNGLGIHVDEGTVESGELLPEGYDKPIKRVIGFVDAGGARNWQNADLNDPSLFSKLTNHFCKNEGLERLDLEVIIVEGTSTDVHQGISEVRAAV